MGPGKKLPAPVPDQPRRARPRRIRALLAGHTVVDTTDARSTCGSGPPFAVLLVPLGDVRPSRALVRRRAACGGDAGVVKLAGLRMGTGCPGAAGSSPPRWPASTTVRFEMVGARCAGTRTSGSSSHRAAPTRGSTPWVHHTVRVECLHPHRVLVARHVLETGLVTRYYLNRTDIDFTGLLHAWET